MPTQLFNSGRIRKAVYEPESRQLDLHWQGGNVLAYQHVPAEVFRRLCSAPNPTTYWEDRIAEEYPKGIPARSEGEAPKAKSLSDLFAASPDPQDDANTPDSSDPSAPSDSSDGSD